MCSISHNCHSGSCMILPRSKPSLHHKYRNEYCGGVCLQRARRCPILTARPQCIQNWKPSGHMLFKCFDFPCVPRLLLYGLSISTLSGILGFEFTWGSGGGRRASVMMIFKSLVVVPIKSPECCSAIPYVDQIDCIPIVPLREFSEASG